MADHTTSSVAAHEQRTAAIELVLRRHGLLASGFIDDFADHADDARVTANGANMVARAWTDPAFHARMLAGGSKVARDAHPERTPGRGPLIPLTQFRWVQEAKRCCNTG